jgi:leucyl aminopeptidase
MSSVRGDHERRECTRVVAFPGRSVETDCDRLVVFVPGRGTAGLLPPAVRDAVGQLLSPAIARSGFTGAAGDSLIVDSLGQLPAGTVALVGVGGNGEVADADVLAAARRAVAGCELGVVALDFSAVGPTALECAVGGVIEGLHRFSLASASARRGPPHAQLEIRVPARDLGEDWQRKADVGRAVAESVCWVRDLIDLPSHLAPPSRLADEAMHLGTSVPISCEVLDVAALRERGFGGVLAVGKGGEEGPCVVILQYRPNGCRPIGLVGKGITFDSGGYNLKGLAEMRLMKADMAGAAAVMGAMRVAACCGLPQDLVAVLPFAENLVDRNAYRPSDTIRHYGGKTSEVVDPDNEGRLVLADALGYVAQFDPTVVIDLATLTDAGGLGRDLWAVLANEPSLAAELLAAGREAGEPGWELPLWAPYRALLRSNVADIANANRTTDNAILAALFLAEFAGGAPWAHVDLGFAAIRGSGADKEATGVGVRTLWRFLSNRHAAASRPADVRPEDGGGPP